MGLIYGTNNQNITYIYGLYFFFEIYHSTDDWLEMTDAAPSLKSEQIYNQSDQHKKYSIHEICFLI